MGLLLHATPFTYKALKHFKGAPSNHSVPAFIRVFFLWHRLFTIILAAGFYCDVFLYNIYP